MSVLDELREAFSDNFQRAAEERALQRYLLDLIQGVREHVASRKFNSAWEGNVDGDMLHIVKIALPIAQFQSTLMISGALADKIPVNAKFCLPCRSGEGTRAQSVYDYSSGLSIMAEIKTDANLKFIIEFNMAFA